jgi:hypothetical protein
LGAGLSALLKPCRRSRSRGSKGIDLGDASPDLDDATPVLDMLDSSPSEGPDATLGSSKIIEQHLAGGSLLPIPPVSPGGRSSQIYFGQPACILKVKGIVWTGWKENAVLHNTTGQPFTFPDIDLVSGDTLKLTARECTEWNNQATGSKAVASANVIFDNQTSVAHTGDGMIWFYLVGRDADSGTGQLVPPRPKPHPGPIRDGMSLTCAYTAGPKAGQTQNFAGVPGATPVPIDTWCGDGQGNFGEAIAQQVTDSGCIPTPGQFQCSLKIRVRGLPGAKYTSLTGVSPWPCNEGGAILRPPPRNTAEESTS